MSSAVAVTPATAATRSLLSPAAARLAVTGSYVAVAAVVAVEVAAPGLLLDRPAVVLAIALVLGLPHGAVDHMVASWVTGEQPTVPRMARLLVAYVGAAGVFLAAFTRWPSIGLAIFLAVSVWHFGTADLALAAEMAGRRLRVDVAAIIALGATPLLVPLVAHPREADAVVQVVAPGAAWPTAPTFRVVAAAVLACCVITTVVRSVRSGRLGDATDLMALVALVTLASPLVAFAVYFGAWHSPRHVARLISLDPVSRTDLAAGRWAAPLRRFAAQAAAPTAVAGTVLALLWWTSADSAIDVVGVNLRILAALTIPHLAVSAWLDWRAPRLAD